MHSRVSSLASGGVKKCTQKCTAPNDRYHDEVTVIDVSERSLRLRVSEWSLGSESLGQES